MNFDIVQVAELLGLIDERVNVNQRQFNVNCPFCGRKRKLNINTEKDAWRCAGCGEHGGMLELYVKVGLGSPVYTKELGSQAAKDIENKLGKEIINMPRKEKVIIDDKTKLSDSELNRIYSELLNIYALSLSSEHRKSLIEKRGISETDINNNEYRSLPDELWFPQGKEWSLNQFRSEGLDKIYQENPDLQKISVKHIIAGLYIGVYLSNYKKIDLTDVPGFFKIKNLWCFRYTPGMLIPVRNIKHEIVGFQVRTDKGKLRYITVSSKGFPEGKSGGTRIHFPISNPEITSKTVVRITEGPLKADIALSMTKESNVAYIAIMGVNSTKELPSTLETLKSLGCLHIKNALDMDKLTNPNVIRGVKNIKDIIIKTGLKYSQMCWDAETAKKILENQEKVMQKNNISIHNTKDNVFLTVLENTVILHKNGIKMPHEWISDKTKGIDDYLKFQQHK